MVGVAASGAEPGGLGEEDTSLRQYWYSASTLRLLCDLCSREDLKCVALLSTPSCPPDTPCACSLCFRGHARICVASRGGRSMADIKAQSFARIFYALPPEARSKVWLLEFDRRWETGNDRFAFFDFNAPVEELPQHLRGVCDLIVADPPHINGATLERYVEAMRMLRAPGGRLVLTTAVDNEQWVAGELGAFPAAFVPKISLALGVMGRYRIFSTFRDGMLTAKNEEDFPAGSAGGSAEDLDGAEEDYAWSLGMVDHPL
mmetsp:Transcript_113459/g.367025  ORF Transcript_113459/g.367025 Transcript_113459/m.367025 type:complete len:260 (+) Transcript_113459:84-863(+)